ncbi:MAG: alpha/beta hydrolase [Pseudomonadota bacterium]
MNIALLFIPGLLCTKALFAPQIKAFEPLVPIHVADHQQDDTIEAVATRALQAIETRKFVAVGLSMGGYVALELARAAPERVAALALIDTSARADRPTQIAQRRALVAQAEDHGLSTVMDDLLPLLLHPARFADGPLPQMVRDMAVETGVATFARQQEAIISRPDMRPDLATIACPTQIIVGANDLITPMKVSREMADAILDARLDVLPNCGHLASLERPHAVTALLRRLLHRVTSSPS